MGKKQRRLSHPDVGDGSCGVDAVQLRQSSVDSPCRTPEDLIFIATAAITTTRPRLLSSPPLHLAACLVSCTIPLPSLPFHAFSLELYLHSAGPRSWLPGPPSSDLAPPSWPLSGKPLGFLQGPSPASSNKHARGITIETFRVLPLSCDSSQHV